MSEEEGAKDQKANEDKDQTEGTASLGLSIFNLANATLGSGILGLAFALANTGIVLFLFLLISLSLLSLYSIHLMVLCAKALGCLHYEHLGEKVFGIRGKYLVFGSTSIQNFGAMLSYLFITKNELPSVLKFFFGIQETSSAWYLDGRLLVLIISFVVLFPLVLMKKLGYLGYTSGLSVSCVLFFLIVIIYKKFQISCPSPYLNITSLSNSTIENMCRAKYIVINSKTVYALPTIAFSLVCHTAVLPIYAELKNRSARRMQKVYIASLSSMAALYLTTAFFGYLTFYDKVKSNLLRSYEAKGDFLMELVRFAIVASVVLTIPVLFLTVRTSLQELLKKEKFKLSERILISLILLTIMDILIFFIPAIKDIFGIMGTTTANLLIFIIPSALFLKITRQDKGKGCHKFFALLFFTLGIIFSLVSIPLVIYDWATSENAAESH